MVISLARYYAQNHISIPREANKMELVGTRLARLICGITFDPQGYCGKAAVSVYALKNLDVGQAFEKCEALMDLAVSSHFKVERRRRGAVLLFTVSQATVCGALLGNGIPVVLRGCGVVQVKDGEALRFVEFLEYEGTTVEPDLIFMDLGLTAVNEMASTGSGKIIASFLEVPVAARTAAEEVLERLTAQGFRCVIQMGEPNAPLLGMLVASDRIGIAITSEANPVAALVEDGAVVKSKIYKLVELSELLQAAPHVEEPLQRGDVAEDCKTSMHQPKIVKLKNASLSSFW